MFFRTLFFTLALIHSQIALAKPIAPDCEHDLVQWERHPVLTDVLRRALVDETWFYTYIKKQPGTWLMMDNGEWTRYVVYPARARNPQTPIRLGSGLSVALERTISAEEFLNELAEDRDVYTAEAPGAGLSAIRNIIEGRYGARAVPEQIPLSSLRHFMTEGWNKIIVDAAAKFARLSRFNGRFVDVDHSWAGWIKMELLPELGSEVESVTLLTPGAQSTDEHLAPLLETLRESAAAGANLWPIPRFLNPAHYWQKFSHDTFRSSVDMTFKNIGSLNDDEVERALAVARFMGVYKSKGYEELAKSAAERPIRIVIAKSDSVIPPSLLAEVVRAARSRGGGTGRQTTTAVIVPGEHDVMEESSTEVSRALARVAHGELPAGLYTFSTGEFKPVTETEFNRLLRGPMMSEWQGRHLRQTFWPVPKK